MKNFSSSLKRIAGLVVGLMIASLIAAAVPAQASGSRTLTIHLHRSHLSENQTAAKGFCDADPCGLYDGINMWTWDMGPDHNGGAGGVQFDQTDDYGVYVQLDITTASKAQGGFITRLGSNWGNAWTKEDTNPTPGTNGDRKINLNAEGDTEVWLVQGDPGVYTYNPLTTRFVNVHYTRTDGDYTGWNVWTWSDGVDGSSVAFSSTDCFGKVATIMVPDSVTSPTISYIVRKSVANNDWFYQTADLTATLTDPASASDNLTVAQRTADVWLVDTTEAGATQFVGGDGKLDYGTPETGPRAALKVHYNRPAGDYTGWNIWHWGGSQAGASASFIGSDDYGKIACVVYPTDAPLTEYGILFRHSVAGNEWESKDIASGETGMNAGNRTITLAAQGQTEVWFKQGKNYVYTTAPELEAVQKSLQSIKATPAKLKRGKTATLPAKTNRNLAIRWTSLTPKVCSISAGKVKGLKTGSCKLSGIQRGNTANQAITTRRTITITR